MKGIFLKELYSINVYKKNLLLMLGIIILMSILLPLGASYVSTMLMVYLVMMLTNLFALDDSSKWDSYAATLPLSRRQIVGTRYLFVSFLVVAANVFGLILVAAISLLRGDQGWLQTNLLLSGGMSLGFLLVAAISMPISYKFGAEKSRLVIMLVYLVPFMGLIWAMPKLEALVGALTSTSITLIVAAVVVLILALYVLSYFISVRIYSKKQF